MSSRVWLVTGASSGFGFEMTRCALGHGDRVVATMRNPASLATFAAAYPPSQLLLLKLDVTSKAETVNAFRKAKEVFGHIDVVFNNAGYALVGEAEATPDDLARKMFDVDFWGAAHVSQEAVRFFRDENKPQGGHLIQNSAAAGLVGVPQLGFYVAAKHALEGFTETLHKEMVPAWDIRITSIQPGAFNTGIAHGLQITPQHPAYSDPSSLTAIIRESLTSANQDGSAPEGPGLGYSNTAKGVERIYELSRLSNPPLRMPLGPDSLKFCREYIEQLTAQVEGYASWSDDLASEGQ